MSPTQQNLANIGQEFMSFCQYFDETMQKEYKETAQEVPFAAYCFGYFVKVLEQIEKDNPNYLPKF